MTGVRRGPGVGRVSRFRRAFTLIELLMVISVIGILAGLLVGLAPAAGAKMRDARVRAELAQLVTMIEEYKARYGFYPPDGLQTVNGRALPFPVLNPLYYELTGMQVINPFDSSRGFFRSLDGNQEVKSDVLLDFFGRDGIVNASPDKRKILVQNLKASQHQPIYPNARAAGKPQIELLVVPVPWPSQFRNSTVPGERPPVPDNPLLNPWRYVSTHPTNNPNSYDLWAEYWRGTNRVIIGNWKR